MISDWGTRYLHDQRWNRTWREGREYERLHPLEWWEMRNQFSREHLWADEMVNGHYDQSHLARSVALMRESEER